MPFVPAQNTCMAELRMILSTQKVENTLYFQASAGMTPALMTSLGTALITWWSNQMSPLLSNFLSLTEVYLTDLTTQTSPTVSVTAGLPIAGTDASEPLPFNVAYCLSFRTAGRGKASRGRNYICGWTEGDNLRSDLLAGNITAITSAYTLLVGAGTFVPGLQWVVVSRFLNNAPRATALVQPITNVLGVDSTLDSQRRRLPGRGR